MPQDVNFVIIKWPSHGGGPRSAKLNYNLTEAELSDVEQSTLM